MEGKKMQQQGQRQVKQICQKAEWPWTVVYKG